MENNIESIFEKIAEVDSELARIFRDVAENLIPENIEIDQVYEGENIFRYPGSNTESNSEKIIDIISSNYPLVNIIPGNTPGLCMPICICNAFGKWNSRKTGFKGIADKLYEYWMACPINRSTLIFTLAWDQIDFNDSFKRIFDIETNNNGKHICVVLFHLSGFSLTYLR